MSTNLYDTPNIDSIYVKLDQYIKLAEAYSEIEHLSFIIKACRIKPHKYVFGKVKYKLVLYDWWFDEYGNSLKITDKKLKIIYNDLSLKRNKIVCTDLYYGLSISKVVKASKLMFMFAGKDEDMLEDCFMLSFLGIDNYLRTYCYLYGEWQQVSSLLLGYENLKIIARDKDIRKFKEIDIKNNMPIACISEKAWLTYLPASDEFLDTVAKQYDVVKAILT